MSSPFPGMDPYLELHWRDVHQSLCTYARDALQPQIRPALRARLEERLVVESEGRTERSIFPDVKIIERVPWESTGSGGGTAVMEMAAPLLLRIESEQATESFIRIIDPTRGGQLVTVIEFLSYSNKLPGKGQQLYKQKQLELRHAGVSLVEIDLLRCGERIIGMPLERLPPEHRATYLICVRRGWKFGEYEVYPAPLHSALPAIRIPLREHDADARLDLQALIELTYQNGAYDDLDYTQPLDPPLDPDDAAWTAALLRKK